MTVAMVLETTTGPSNLPTRSRTSSLDEDGELVCPMRVAKARATKATAIARSGDLGEAPRIGNSVFEIQRHGIPEIMRQAAELDDLLAAFKGGTDFRRMRAALGRIGAH